MNLIIKRPDQIPHQEQAQDRLTDHGAHLSCACNGGGLTHAQAATCVHASQVSHLQCVHAATCANKQGGLHALAAFQAHGYAYTAPAVERCGVL